MYLYIVTEFMAITGKNAIQKAINIIENDNINTSKKYNINDMNKELIYSEEKRFSWNDINEWKNNTQQYYNILYNTALLEAMHRYPNDPDIKTIYAESLLNLTPWDYYKKLNTIDYVDKNYSDISKLGMFVKYLY
jgi:hypothetical protein